MMLDIYQFDENMIQSRKNREKATIELEKLQKSMLDKINDWYRNKTISSIFKEIDIQNFCHLLNSICQTYPEANYQILDIWFDDFKRQNSLQSDTLSTVVLRMPIDAFVESIP